MYKALIIDDERPVRQTILALGNWERFGIAPPREAPDGQTALDMMARETPDIVFVDMRMYNMDGLTFLQHATSLFPKTKYIVVSGYDDFHFAQRCIQYKVVDYLLKPIVEEELLGAIIKSVRELETERPGAPAPENRLPLSNSEKFSIDTVILDIKDYIDQNYAKDISLSVFAGKYFVSKEYLSRSFKSRYNMGIYEYVLHKRMEKAVELLLHTSIKISEISQSIGYQDHNYFSRAFMRYYGYPPSQCRGQKDRKAPGSPIRFNKEDSP